MFTPLVVTPVQLRMTVYARPFQPPADFLLDNTNGDRNGGGVGVVKPVGSRGGGVGGGETDSDDEAGGVGARLPPEEEFRAELWRHIQAHAPRVAFASLRAESGTSGIREGGRRPQTI